MSVLPVVVVVKCRETAGQGGEWRKKKKKVLKKGKKKKNKLCLKSQCGFYFLKYCDFFNYFSKKKKQKKERDTLIPR